jgi:hypothetical protein
MQYRCSPRHVLIDGKNPSCKSLCDAPIQPFTQKTTLPGVGALNQQYSVLEFVQGDHGDK